MREFSFDATTNLDPQTSQRMAWEAAHRPLAAHALPVEVLHARFFPDMKALKRRMQGAYLGRTEDYWEIEREAPPWTGWKLVAIWTGAVAGSWALALACMMLVRALL